MRTRTAVSIILPPVLGVLLLGCAPHGDAPPPPTPDWTPPVWTILSERADAKGVDLPTDAELAAEYTRVTQCWLDYWQKQSKGQFKPDLIPCGDASALVEFTRKRSSSAEDQGRGKYGVVIHVWNHTKDEPRSKTYVLQATCHHLSHVISGTGSAGNAAHELFRKVCGC